MTVQAPEEKRKIDEYVPDPNWVAVPVSVDFYFIEYARRVHKEREEKRRQWKSREDTQ